MSKCPRCGYIQVSRSKAQNDSYWKFTITPAAEYCGVKTIEFHDSLRDEWFERVIPFKTKDGIVMKRVHDGTTTTMTVKEFNEYWDWADRRVFEICGFFPQKPNEPPITE